MTTVRDLAKMIDHSILLPTMTDDDLERVFDRHYRGQNIEGKGAGLGLAIVKRLCELYGWSIHFSNRKEGGLCAELKFFGE